MNYANILRFNEPISQMSMVWRLESSWVYLALFINDSCTCCGHLLSVMVDFILLSDIYIAFYFELADDIYLVLVPCTDPYLYVSFFVIYGNAANVPSTSTQPQL